MDVYMDANDVDGNVVLFEHMDFICADNVSEKKQRN